MLETSRRLAPVERRAFALVLAAAVVAIPHFGLAPLLSTALAALFVAVAHARVKRYRRPELLLAGAWLCAQLAFAAGIALSDGPHLYLLAVMAFPTMLSSVIFPARMVIVGTVVSVLSMLAIAFGLDLQAVLDGPQILTYPLVLVLGTAIIASRVRDLDAESRSTAVVDRLTGMLNRVALTPRLAELEHQSGVTGEQVAMVVGDVDRFKSINDEHGHAVGDVVLKQVAERLRTALGTFESIYRLGGEEFIVLLAGMDAHAAAGIAERLRHAVRATPIDGLAVTMSFGAAASAPGEFMFESVFSEADAALYEAKRGGRDRVRLITGPGPTMRNGAVVPASRANDLPVASDTLTREVLATAAVAPSAEGWNGRMAFERKTNGNWLVRDDVERDHLLDLAYRARDTHALVYPLVFAAVFGATPWFGPLSALPPLIGVVISRVISARLLKFRHPDLALGAAYLVAQTGSIVGFMCIQSHAAVPISIIAMPVLLMIAFSATFPTRGVVTGVAITAVNMVAAALVMNTHQVLHNPTGLVYALAVLGAVSLVGRSLGASATNHRGAAVVDQLTGMLNRVALEARVAELAHQAAITDGQVALILADLDHFKSVNDEHGHGIGDAVLRDIAYRLRADLRAFESAYRIGGEEFVVLLAGADAPTAAAVAERLRLAVHDEPAAGIDVTMSFGVAASEPGDAFDYTAVFARADTVLYEAKAGGRDCVMVDGALAPRPVRQAA